MLAPDTKFMITGGASGIGAATAELLVAKGHRVAVCDINRELTLTLCERLGDAAQPLYLDVREATDWERAVGEVWNRLGGLDVLINNAGLAYPGLLYEVASEKHLQMLEVNVFGVILGMRTVLPRFLEQGHGHVINTSSLASFVPMAGLATYAASKHAVRAVTHGCALEMRDTPLKFSVVCPAAVQTPMLDKQVDDPDAVLSFADPILSAAEVAAGIVEAAETGCSELLIPRGRGLVLKVAGVFPRLVRAMVGSAVRRGRKEMERRR